MSQRTVYVVCYDISEPKRLRQVYRTMRGYGDHMQLSVFRCELTDAEKTRLLTELGDIVCHTEDQVMFAPLGPPEGHNATHVETIGRPLLRPDRHAVVV